SHKYRKFQQFIQKFNCSYTFFTKLRMYTIGQVSEMFDLPISTLRYYDKEGFFPNLVRKGNIRYFSNNEIEALRLIECLKKSGLGIKEINQFFTWVSQGSASYENRKELFEARKLAVEAEIKNLQKTLSLLEFKCWYYSKAMEDGTEEYIREMLPDKLPSDIQKLYDASRE
ncbi:MerR family transcriptional regulator, partial [uncultured Holdemanella sp.]|uniref:MerR family transcriptional regulator n=2 Tax=uncultured Holdemanella sp. TaxID=1763549 RepID=UPI0025D392DE